MRLACPCPTPAAICVSLRASLPAYLRDVHALSACLRGCFLPHPLTLLLVLEVLLGLELAELVVLDHVLTTTAAAVAG